MIPEDNRPEILRLLKENEEAWDRVKKLRTRLKELGCPDQALEYIERFDEVEYGLQLSWDAYPHRSACPCADDWKSMEASRRLREQLKNEFGIDLPHRVIIPKSLKQSGSRNPSSK